MDKWLQTFFDMTARKPSGWLGKLMYRKPVGHYGFFHVAIEKLQFQPRGHLSRSRVRGRRFARHGPANRTAGLRDRP